MKITTKTNADDTISVQVNDKDFLILSPTNFYIDGANIKELVKTWTGGCSGKLADRFMPPKQPKVAYKYVDSSRGDEVYRITLVDGSPVACTCKSFAFHGPCKHMAGLK